MKNRWVFGVLMVLGWILAAGAVSAEEAGKAFVISQYLIEIDGGGNGVITVRGSNIQGRGESPVVSSIIDEKGLSVGKLFLSVAPDGGLLANGSPVFQPEDGFRVISAPRIVVAEGEEAKLRSGTVSNVQYMDRQPDGDFSLRTVEPGLEPGMMMRLIVRSVQDGDGSVAEVELEYGVKATFMVGRDPIPEVRLEIGKPVFETREAETRLRVPLNRWMLLHSITGKDGSNGDSTRLISMIQIEEKTP